MLNILRLFWPLILLSLLLASCLCVSCKRNTVAVPQNPDKTLIVFVGGFGDDQLGDCVVSLEQSHPSASFVTFNGHDEWQTDLAGYVAKSTYTHLVLVGHSWGTARIIEDAAKIKGTINLVVFYDPVGFHWEQEMKLPGNVGKAVVFPRLGLGPVPTAKIIGTNVEVFPLPGGHSDGCHNGDSFRIINDELKGFP